MEKKIQNDIFLKSIYNSLILVIDEDEEFLNKLCSILHKAGFYKVKKATTYSEAINICNLYNPFLIIMEYSFQNISGKELIQKVKKYCTKIIVLSGSEKLADSFKSLEYGALSFIHKKDKHWEISIIDSVITWGGYYKTKESRRVDFRNKLNALTV